ncbi:MAG: hypothetical protein RR482_00020 [Clostridia bacterium]
MRKYCMLLLVGLLIFPAVHAKAAPPAPLSMQELASWRNVLYTQLRDATPTNDPVDTYDPQAGDVYLFTFPFGTADVASPTFDTPGNPVLGIELLTDAFADPRGLRVGDSVQTVLAAYPNDNPSLTGDARYAALYAHDVQDKTHTLAWGWLLREKDAVQSLQYDVSVRQTDGTYLDVGLLYVIHDGQVSAIRLYGFDSAITEEEATANLHSVQEIAQRTSFTPGKISSVETATRFGLDDLLFSDLNFLTATPESIRALLGAPQEERTLKEGEQLFLMTYPDALFEFSLDAQNGARLRAVLVHMSTLLGPRGLRVGDTFGDVLDRFYRAWSGEDGDQIPLYGTLDTPPFGFLTYEAGGDITLRYAFPHTDAGRTQTYVLHLSFQNQTLREYLLYIQ